MKTSWRPVAVIGSLLLSSCTAKGLFGLFGGAATGSNPGLAETLGGKWFACGMPDQYLDLSVDASGSISGKVVEKGTPVFEVRGVVREGIAIDGIINEATATIEFVPLTPGSGSVLRFEDVGANGSDLRGIKGAAGTSVLLQRAIDPGVRTCPGIPMIGTTPGPASSPTFQAVLPGSVDFGAGTSPGPSPAGTPAPSPAISGGAAETPGPSPSSTLGASPAPSPTASSARTPTPAPTPVPPNTVVGGFIPD